MKEFDYEFDPGINRGMDANAMAHAMPKIEMPVPDITDNYVFSAAYHPLNPQDGMILEFTSCNTFFGYGPFRLSVDEARRLRDRINRFIRDVEINGTIEEFLKATSTKCEEDEDEYGKLHWNHDPEAIIGKCNNGVISGKEDEDENEDESI